jgi:short-subunit dehydrogenase
VSCLCPGPTVSKVRERAGTGKTRLAKNAGAAMASAPVARAGYNAWKQNRAVIVTGGRNAFQAGLVKFIPRKTLLRMVRNIQSPAT